MKISDTISDSLNRFLANSLTDASVIVLDDQSYFQLKEEMYGTVELAIDQEITEYLGLKVFHNNLGYSYVNVH